MNKQSSPLVSVIVPVYNVVFYIKECIESIQTQTYPNIEIIIVDDGSTDGSGEICGELAERDSRIRLIHQENAGVVSARGRGVEASEGKYLSFVDGDDWVEPNMIEGMVRDIGEADLISTKIQKEARPGEWVEEYDKFPEGVYSGETGLAKVFETMIFDLNSGSVYNLTPGVCNKLFLKDKLQKVYLEVPPQLTFAEDSVLLYKYLLDCHALVISHKCFYHYRYREGSAVHRIDRQRLININRVYLSLEDDFRNHRLKDSLLVQLQRWIRHMTCRAVNEFMGFDPSVYIQEYITDLSGLKNKKIIVYGAGVAGRNAHRQLKKLGYTVVLWADKNYALYQSMGMSVSPPEEILSLEYDVIYIAVAERTLAGKIKKELTEKGIEEDCLFWREPVRFF